MKCAKCGRSLKNPSPTLMGPVCARNVLGIKPKRIRREHRNADEATPDLFAQELECALRFHEAVAGVSLEMT